ncbi:hypothetical protein WR25_14266 [Diploscapter pachys]|uniref:Uncharacterized protein n=1 Tax=Diploscapter pachys TaxID=2018661 RepID=A0A2A2KD39_9BILA|nr:hypothetical protein WR25_14266 [Diploscapter pachys]
MTREAKKVIRQSQILQEQIETEARERPEQKDRLLDAARKVATATSNMIEATRECESRPTEAESEMALRNAAERLANVTNETTSEQQARYIMERLEEAAKATAYDSTQTIAAANQAKEIITTRSSVELLVYECTQTAEHVPKLITCIRESQQAKTSEEKFRAQSRLIRQSNEIVSPATRLVESSRTSINSISEPHVASHLHETSSSLANSLVKLRTALNAAQQLNFSQQLVYSEALIRELDEYLQDTQRMAHARQLHPQRGVTASSACTKLMSTSRHVGSAVAQLVTAASANDDQQHIGASAVELAQNLRDFTEEIRDVLSVRSDVNIDRLVVSARSVVHDSGLAFDKVREKAPAAQLSEVARQVANSLRQVIACIPDNQHVETAIQEIRKVSASTPSKEMDVRTAAQKLVESTSELLLSVNQPQHNEAVNAFVGSYTNFHTAVIAAIKNLPDMPARIATTELLEKAREEAISVLSRSSLASTDISHMQELAEESRSFTSTVNQLVDSIGGEEPWQRECDAALRQIQAVRHLAEQATVPVNDDSYFGSLDRVTEEARKLGEAMTGIARNAKNLDTSSLCTSVRSSADAVCRLAEAANQSAYLVGVANPRSTRGRAAIVDGAALRRSAQLVKQVCDRIATRNYSQEQLLNDTTIAAKHTSSIANMCRNASERSVNVNVKKHLVNSAKELAAKTSALITAVRAHDTRPTPETEAACTETAAALKSATEQLEHFIENPDFAALPGQISDEGRANQRPVLSGTRQMLDASAEMIKTARSLASAPRDSAIWQRLADNSRDVSDSIKGLVAAIRDAAPGQAEMDRAIEFLQKLIVEIERSAMDAYKSPNTVKGPQKRMQQQVGHATHALEEKVDPLRMAAKGKGEDLPHCVEDHCRTTEALVMAACQAASLSPDSATQAEMFERAKTVVEAELEMMVASRDAGGNQKAQEAHRRVDEAAEQLKDALSDMRKTVGKISSDEGAVEGLVDNIAHSIESTDSAAATQGTFADVQTRMVAGLEAIRSIANDMPYAKPEVLGGLAVNMSEKYRGVAMDARQAITMLTNPDLSHRLKLSVQKLGNSCIQTVKIAGKKRAYPTDTRISETLLTETKIVVERVEEVLAALHEGSKGTQACINAANTVSGIIGDLDTTILFATSGTLNPSDAPRDFQYHRDVILKTAKALVEDTKALVAGAASNQVGII